MLDETRRCLAEALGIEVALVEPDLTMGDLPEWDSIGHVVLMSAIENRFNMQIPLERIAELTTLDALVQFVEANTAKAMP